MFHPLINMPSLWGFLAPEELNINRVCENDNKLQRSDMQSGNNDL